MIRSIPGTLRACQPSISLCQHANYIYAVWSLPFAFLDLDTFGGNFDLWFCVCVMGTIMGPLREQSGIERIDLCPRTPDDHAGHGG